MRAGGRTQPLKQHIAIADFARFAQDFAKSPIQTPNPPFADSMAEYFENRAALAGRNAKLVNVFGRQVRMLDQPAEQSAQCRQRRVGADLQSPFGYIDRIDHIGLSQRLTR